MKCANFLSANSLSHGEMKLNFAKTCQNEMKLN